VGVIDQIRLDVDTRMSMAVVVEVSVIIFVSVVNSVRFMTAKLEG
jgi:hypothetical protein